MKPLKLKKTVSLSDSDEDNKENDTICISPEKANITKGGFQQYKNSKIKKKWSHDQESMNCWKPKKTVSIESPADLDRTTTQGLGKANPMVEVIIYISIAKTIRYTVFTIHY